MRKLALAVLAFLPAMAPAQEPGASACLDALDEQAMKAVPVALVLTVPEPFPALRTPAEALTWLLADELRSLLGLPEGQLRDAGLGWRDLYGEMRIYPARDGTVGWRVEGTGGPPRRGYVLMDSALSRIASGSFAFPREAVRGDSQSFVLEFQWPDLGRDGVVKPLHASFAIPLFTVRRPWQEHVQVLSRGRSEYPDVARRSNAQGTVIMEAFVDTAGRVDSATLRDLWTGPRPRGEAAAMYEEFVRSSRRMMLRMKFRPAIIGGCVARERVRQPFGFGIAR